MFLDINIFFFCHAIRCLERAYAHMEDTFKPYHAQTNPHSSRMDYKGGKTLPNNTTAFYGLNSRPLVKLGETPTISLICLVVLIYIFLIICLYVLWFLCI